MYFLGFVEDNCKKISYGTSFGKSYKGTKKEKEMTISNLRRFDKISVRDQLSYDICTNNFGLKDITQVCDPTFLCNFSDYEILIKMSKAKEDEQYLLAYILDPSSEIGHRLENLSEKKKLKIIIILDKLKERFNINKKKIGFHGTIFSIIFKKPFITLKNKIRGPERFISLLKPLALIHRLFDTEKCITHNSYLLDSCQYTIPYKKLEKIKEKSYHWLEKALKQ